MKKFTCGLLIAVMLLGSVLMTGCGKSAGNDSITVFNYGMYIEPEILKIFEEETGIKVKYEEAATPEELYTKFVSGAIKYDVLCTSDYMIKRIIDEGRAQKVDYKKLENVSKNIGQKYWDFNKPFDATSEYALPYFWGTVGILYDTTKVHGPIDSWDVLYNGEYKNEIIMQDSMRDAYMVTLKSLGYSLNTSNIDEIKEAHARLIAQKPDVSAYLVDEVRDELVAGNATLGVIYSGEAILGHEYNENLEYVVPKEGSNVWVDSWVVTKDGNMDVAEKWLDFLCREDIAMMNFEYVYYSSPNEAVIANMDEELKNNEIIVPKEETTANCELNLQNDPEIVQLYNELWKELKAE